MYRSRLCILTVMVGCGEPSYFPQPGMPAYGEGGEWQDCSGQVAGELAGSSLLVVDNTLTEPVDLILVDEACDERLMAELASGEVYEAELEHGLVFAVRGQGNRFLYHHFKWLGQYETVVVP